MNVLVGSRVLARSMRALAPHTIMPTERRCLATPVLEAPSPSSSQPQPGLGDALSHQHRTFVSNSSSSGSEDENARGGDEVLRALEATFGPLDTKPLVSHYWALVDHSCTLQSPPEPPTPSATLHGSPHTGNRDTVRCCRSVRLKRCALAS